MYQELQVTKRVAENAALIINTSATWIDHGETMKT
jgi:hypothetical protein